MSLSSASFYPPLIQLSHDLEFYFFFLCMTLKHNGNVMLTRPHVSTREMTELISDIYPAGGPVSNVVPF